MSLFHLDIDMNIHITRCHINKCENYTAMLLWRLSVEYDYSYDPLLWRGFLNLVYGFLIRWMENNTWVWIQFSKQFSKCSISVNSRNWCWGKHALISCQAPRRQIFILLQEDIVRNLVSLRYAKKSFDKNVG